MWEHRQHSYRPFFIPKTSSNLSPASLSPDGMEQDWILTGPVHHDQDGGAMLVKEIFKSVDESLPLEGQSITRVEEDHEPVLAIRNRLRHGGKVVHTPPIQDMLPSSSSECLKKYPANIVFIKVHKSGSTTVANLLARYAVSNDLNIALPSKIRGQPYINAFRSVAQKNVIRLPEGQHYNVLFNHMIYNRPRLRQLMPNDTFYCAIMREPLSRFCSSVNYYPHLIPPSLRHYLLFGPKASPRRRSKRTAINTSADLATLLESRAGKILKRRKEVYNTLTSDTGLPVSKHANKRAVKEHARKLDRELDLMMVMEHFDESLVLFKRRACLRMKDIVYLRLNTARRYRVRPLSARDQAVVRAWQAADHYMYGYFYSKFLEEVHKERQIFWQEVAVFRDILQKVKTFCEKVPRHPVAILSLEPSHWNELFTVSAKDCALMQLKELVFQRLLISRAMARRGVSANTSVAHSLVL